MFRVRNLFMIFFLIVSVPGITATHGEYGQTVETQLRQHLNIPDGPATQFLSFDFPDNGVFVVLTTDLAMGNVRRTPFGTQQTRSRRPDHETVITAMKQAILACATLRHSSGTLHLVIVDRSLFSNPFENSGAQLLYKAWIPLDSLSDARPGKSIRTQAPETR